MSQLLDNAVGKGKQGADEVSKRSPTIELYSSDIYEKLKNLATKNESNLRKYSNEILSMHVDKEIFLEKHMSNMKKIGFEDGIF